MRAPRDRTQFTAIYVVFYSGEVLKLKWPLLLRDSNFCPSESCIERSGKHSSYSTLHVSTVHFNRRAARSLSTLNYFSTSTDAALSVCVFVETISFELECSWHETKHSKSVERGSKRML